MNRPLKTAQGFTVVELLVVLVVIAILAALLFPTLSKARDRASRTTCINNLKQINLGLRVYSDDANDATPSPGSTTTNVLPLYAGYKELMKNYVGLKGKSSSQDKLFACPADTFYPSYVSGITNTPSHYVRESLHDSAVFDYSSYAFNGGDNKPRPTEVGPWTPPGLTGVKLSVVRNPSRTILVAETSTLVPWSWHEPILTEYALPRCDAKNVVSFVDGHISYIKIYWNATRYPNGGISFAFGYDPPAEYEYQWSGN